MTDVQQLIRQLRDRATWEQANKALIEMGSAAVEPLLAQLNSSEQPDRALAIGVLKKINDPRIVPALIELSTHDPVVVVRSDAVSAVAAFTDDPRVRDFLLQTARSSTQDVTTRMMAVLEMKKLAGADAANSLWLELLNDPSPNMVMNAANQLGDTKKPEFFEPLMALSTKLGDAETVLPTVLSALARLGDKRAFEPIAARLKSPKVNVRAAAVHALTYLGDVRALDVLEPLKRDTTISGQEDRGGPSYTLGSEVKKAIDSIRRANGMLNDISDERPPKPWWKFW